MSKFPCIDGLTKNGFRSFTLHFVETFKLVSDGISLGSTSSHCSFNDKKMVHFMKSSFVMRESRAIHIKMNRYTLM
jgi:hypothetical protein